MAWDPTLYLKFGDERLRPGFDLLARVGELSEGPLYELGCGTGVHARAIVDTLMNDHGIFIRMPGVASLNRCVRVSTAPEAELALFAAALPEVLKKLA